MPYKPPDPTRADQVALFRLGVIGDLLSRPLERGELQDELKLRAQRRYRPPGASASRSYHWKTLQSWYYAARDGLDGLRPASRSRGLALALDDDQREILLEMRRAHCSAAVDMILSEAVRNGIIAEGEVSPSTLRRLFREHGLSRQPQNRHDRRERRRWDSGRVGAVWHMDVCHVWRRDADGKPVKAYVHAIIDDHSRYVVGLSAREHEQETDALSVFCAALLQHPACGILYVDNGSCYKGEVLALALERLGIRLVHTPPGEPQGRGKLERWFRTMRQRCTDHLVGSTTLSELNAALFAFLDADYHRRPHPALLGRTPYRCYVQGIQTLPRPRTAAELARALEVTLKPVVRKDATVQVRGRLYEVRGRHLAGKRISVRLDPFTDAVVGASYEDLDVVIGPCDPVANADRPQSPLAPEAASTTPFDPIAGMLARARKESPDA
jgi:transposase InsO family protein